MNEYAEIIGQHMGSEVMELTLNAITKHRFVEKVENIMHRISFTKTPDDNKFVDCSIACNADFLVTEDRHFNILHSISFPKVTPIKIADFREILVTV